MNTAPPEPWLVQHRYLVLLCLGLLLTLPYLGARDLWYPDEPDIGEVAQSMYVSGDWIAPRRNGVIWVDYTPLLYWAGSASSHALGGVSEFSLRLPCSLGAIALALLVCSAASRWFSARAGLWAGLMLITFPQFLYGGVSYRPDMLLSLPIGAGMLAYAAGSGERARWGPRALAFALFGVALLAKGPIGLLLPGLVLTLWHGSRREWKRLFQMAPLTLVALVVALPWFFACARAMGEELFWNEIYLQNLGRYESGSRGHLKPLHYYLMTIWVDLGPWIFMLPFAIGWLVRTGRWRDRNVQLLLWWLGTFFVFLSVAATKRQIYMMPAYPAVALLLAPWFATLFQGEGEGRAPNERAGRWFLKGSLAWALFVGALLIFVAVALDPIVERFELTGSKEAAARAARGPLLGLGLVSVGAGIWIWRAYRSGALRSALLRVAAAMVPFYLMVGIWAAPAFNDYKTYAPQCEWILEQIGDESHVGLYFPGRAHMKKGAFGYYTGRLVSILMEPEELEDFFAEHPDSLVLVSDTVSDELFARTDVDWRSRVVRQLEAGHYQYFAVRGD